MGFDGKTHTLDRLWNENISFLLAQNGFKMFKSHFKCYAEKGGISRQGEWGNVLFKKWMATLMGLRDTLNLNLFLGI